MSSSVRVARGSGTVRMIMGAASLVLASGVSVVAFLGVASVATQGVALAATHRPGALEDWRRPPLGFAALIPARAERPAPIGAAQARLDDAFRTATAARRGEAALEARLAQGLTAPDRMTVASIEAPRVISPDAAPQLASVIPTAPVAVAAVEQPALQPPLPVEIREAAVAAPEAPAEPAAFVPLPRPRPADLARIAQERLAPGPRTPIFADRQETAAPETARRVALAYAPAPEVETRREGSGDLFRGLLNGATGLKLPAIKPGVAVYDIATATVRLPNGEVLEAHSGLAHRQDNPAYVREKNRGPTPPNVYNLRMREARFHGSEAIRLLPRDQKRVFNRDGLLAHPYMYAGGGSRSQSNGCVVFKDYGRFLRAFKAGEIAKLVVVPNISELRTAMAGL